MRKIVAFGDSWTHGQGVEDDVKYKNVKTGDYIFTLRMCNSWPRYLADKLDLPFLNYGYPGADNVHISDTVNLFFDKLNKDDIVLIMFSFPYRHAHGLNTFVKIKDIVEKLQKKLNGYNYYFLNSFCKTFEFDEDVKNTIDLSRFIQVDTTAADVLMKYEQDNDVGVWEYGNRKVYTDAKNFAQGDYHPNIHGYKVIADWVYKELQNKL